MSNFRIKKIPKTQYNIKDSNTLEIKHRQKIKQIDTKKLSITKLTSSLNKINEELFKIDKLRETHAFFDMEKRADLLNNKKKLEDELDSINTNMDEINYFDMTGDLLTEYYMIRDVKQTTEIKNILEYLKPDTVIKKSTINTKAVNQPIKTSGYISSVKSNKNKPKYHTHIEAINEKPLGLLMLYDFINSYRDIIRAAPGSANVNLKSYFG